MTELGPAAEPESSDAALSSEEQFVSQADDASSSNEEATEADEEYAEDDSHTRPAESDEHTYIAKDGTTWKKICCLL